MAKPSSFHAIGAILKEILGPGKGLSPLEKYRLWTEWADAVGPEISAHSSPESWQGDRLVIAVPDSCWLQELRMQETAILEQIQNRYPSLTIRGLRWKVKN